MLHYITSVIFPFPFKIFSFLVPRLDAFVTMVPSFLLSYVHIQEHTSIVIYL